MPSPNSTTGRFRIPRGTPSVWTVKRSLYFDPDGVGVQKLGIPVVSSLHNAAEHAELESLEPFASGRERIRGCKVGIRRNQRRHFYMIYTKYRRTDTNYAIIEESGNQESWNGPLVVMRLDTASATRLVSITSKTHKDMAIQAVARFTRIMNASISTLPHRMVRWPQRLLAADS